MQSGKLSRRINLMTAVLTFAVAAAAFVVLSAARTKMLNDESLTKKANQYSDLRRSYTQTGNGSASAEITPAALTTPESEQSR